MTTDRELLRRYAERKDETAFAEVVHRHLPMVYFAALRQVGGDACLAEEVAQNVFAILANRAAELVHHSTLVGWLHTCARYIASKSMREQRRRLARVQAALVMHDQNTLPEPDLEAIFPILDEALGQLDETDRNVLLLRFFQGKSYREVAAILGLSENTASKRLERALEKLRRYFFRRGVRTTTALLASVITATATTSIPAGLDAKVTVASLAIANGAGNILYVAWPMFLMSTRAKIISALIALAILAVIPWAVPLWQTAQSSPAATNPQSATVAGAPAADSTAPTHPDNGSAQPSGSRSAMMVRVGPLPPVPATVAGLRPNAENWAMGVYAAAGEWSDVGSGSPEKTIETFFSARKLNDDAKIIALRFQTPVVMSPENMQRSRPRPAGADSMPNPAATFDPGKIVGVTLVDRVEVSTTEVKLTVVDKLSEPLPGFGDTVKEIFDLQLKDGAWKWMYNQIAPDH